MTKEYIASVFASLQDEICQGLEVLDGKAKFQEDNWERELGGGGRTRTIQAGNLIEKGGVAFSAVHGDVTEEMKKQLNMEGNTFFATGVSIVLHPENPHVPIIHMNVRYFQLDDETYWFGGGIDLTPHYVVPTQAKEFHQSLKSICDQFDSEFYGKFKPWADRYFYIPHRGESRGIGGIFYDHLSEKNSSLSKEKLLEFALALGRNFVPIYSNQAQKGRNLSYNEEELAWRNIRRGRYVEFNLVHDRGTKFGLHSGGRTESILMSLPPLANWEYNQQPKADSREAFSLEMFRNAQDWLGIEK
jgi:coproporphyrinogen III oxidase